MKKKSLIILAFILAFNFSFAQKKKTSTSASSSGQTSSSSSSSSRSSGMGFDSGDFVISGSFGVNSSSGTTTFKILPSAAYFIKDNMAIVGSIGYEQGAGSSSAPIAISGLSAGSDDIIIAAGLRLFKNPKSQFSLFAQGLIEFRSQSFGGGGSGTQFGIVFSPGINYFVSNNFSIDATFGEFGFGSQSGSGGGSTSGVKLGIDMRDIGFGLNYKF